MSEEPMKSKVVVAEPLSDSGLAVLAVSGEVVLAVGMEPSVSAANIPAEIVSDSSGFIEQDQANGAIFGAGCAANPLDVNRSVQSATASALRAIQVINRVARAEG